LILSDKGLLEFLITTVFDTVNEKKAVTKPQDSKPAIQPAQLVQSNDKQCTKTVSLTVINEISISQ